MNICVHPAFYYVFQHLALITIKAQKRLFSQNMLDKISEKPRIYKALSHFCVIITPASILRTIPVAFMYMISFTTS